MTIKVQPDGETRFLNHITNQGVDMVWTYRLYINDYTPTDTSILANFQEAGFPGYAGDSNIVWNPALQANGRAEIEAAAITFTCTGGGAAESVYGYYVTDTGGALLFAERFDDGPYVMSQNQDEITITPKLTCESKFA